MKNTSTIQLYQKVSSIQGDHFEGIMSDVIVSELPEGAVVATKEELVFFFDNVHWGFSHATAIELREKMHNDKSYRKKFYAKKKKFMNGLLDNKLFILQEVTIPLNKTLD